MKIHDRDHTIVFDPDAGTLTVTGTLRSMTRDYAGLRELLAQILQISPPRLELDVRGLRMINSSALNTLSRFVLALRGKPGVRVTFHGSHDVAWHARTLANMKHFLPTAQVVLR
jgi:hypothetical protein